MTPLVRNLLMAVGAIALLTGVTIGVVWLRNGASSPIAQIQGEKASASVLVAARAIEPGALLRAEDFLWRDTGVSNPPAGALVRGRDSDAELVGALARKGFAQGEVITASGVLKPSERGFLAATLRPGFRAVTIPIEAQQSASGLVLPGDRVDVILVQQFDSRSGTRRSSGETILRDARVVAAGHAMETAPKAQTSTQGADAGPPRTLTLEALPKDAERLFVAAQLGKLEVALRPVAEPNTVVAEARPVWAGDVSAVMQSGSSSADAAAPGVTTGKRSSHTRRAEVLPPVEVLRGSKSTQ